MEVVQVLCMKGGNGDTSYAKNSLVQKKVISLTKPIIEEAITNLYCNKFPTSLCIADLGCSSGPNTLFAVLEVVTTVDRVGKKMGRQLSEIQVFLNDLPGNDFNTIFKSLPRFQKDLEKRMGAGAESCFINGVPGSFYGRLFPSKSLHFIHSSYSLQWLNIYMASSSPPSVLKAYYEQFQTDFSMFLRCRSEELLEGGSMVLTFLGRRSEDPSSKECCYIWELLAVALNDMVAEVKCEVEKEGSFTISRLEVSEVNWNAYHGEFCPSDAHKDEEVFSRYQKIVADRMSREKTEFVNVTVSMTKRG
ncbi:hypothetical protein AAG906_033198 [Vitis piasezkii]